MSRYPADHKARTREALLETARAAFRREGFDTLSIDKLMRAAGLTRGGFYNHFESKEALVHEVLQIESGLVEGLREAGSGAQAADVLDRYLAPEEREDRIQCPLVAHPIDARRGDEQRRALYGAQVRGLIEALGAHTDVDTAALATALAVGAAVLSVAVDDAATAERIETTARRALRDLLE